MATGLFSSSSRRKRNGSAMATSVDDQLQEMRDDISRLATLIADRGAAASQDAKSRARDVREQAEADFQDLLASGEQMLSDLRRRYADTERELRRTVREHPVATVGVAAIIGLIAAAMLRR